MFEGKKAKILKGKREHRPPLGDPHICDVAQIWVVWYWSGVGGVVLVRHGQYGVGQTWVVWCWSDMGSVVLVRHGYYGVERETVAGGD